MSVGLFVIGMRLGFPETSRLGPFVHFGLNQRSWLCLPAYKASSCVTATVKNTKSSQLPAKRIQCPA